MSAQQTLRAYFVLGEASGDALGADLLPELESRSAARGHAFEASGLAGRRMTAHGMDSLFDIEDIAVMGISAVVARLPTIVRRVYRVVADVIEKSPDILILIDSPDFTHAVAKRVRRKMPDLPIVNYVCPSVWAWRSGRAKSMRSYVDHVLAILPFEPDTLDHLDGPLATYVGHPLARQITHEQNGQDKVADGDPPVLLVLPGSRSSEVSRLLAPFGETLGILKSRGVEFQAVLPAVPHLRDRIEKATDSWPVKPAIVDSAQNDVTFRGARAALAASGTVTLQLALHRVPMVACYKLDAAMTLANSLITIWSSNLPNLIADSVLVPEEFNNMVRPHRLARYLEELLGDTLARRRQMEGLEDIIEAMQTQRSAAEISTDVIFDLLDKRQN